MLGDLLSGIGGGLLEVLKTAGPLLLPGLVMKHVTKLPNDLIPVVNGAIGIGVGWAVTGDPGQGAQMGVLAATGSVGMHQVLKMGTRKLFPKVQSL